MAYNLTGFNATTYIGFTTQVNDLIQNSFNISYFAIILGVIFSVLFFGLMRRYKVEDAALSASFVSMLVGVMFIFANLLSFDYLWYLLGIFIATLIIKVVTEFK